MDEATQRVQVRVSARWCLCTSFWVMLAKNGRKQVRSAAPRNDKPEKQRQEQEHRQGQRKWPGRWRLHLPLRSDMLRTLFTK